MTFDELCEWLLDPPVGTLHARVRWSGSAEHTWYIMGGQYPWGPGPRVAAPEGGEEGGDESVLELWRDGQRLRVEVNGQLRYLSDGQRSWMFRTGSAVSQLGSTHGPGYTGDANWLVNRPPAGDWSVRGDAADGTVEEDACTGRPAWKVTVGDVVAWFDRETRYTLALGFAGATYREELVDAEFGMPLDAGLFTWVGPTMSPQEHLRQEKAEKAAAARRRMRTHVASDLSPVPVTLDLTPILVPVHDDVTGEFSAYGEGFSLNRTRRADRPGETAVDEPSSELHRWSTPDFDWELTVENLVSVDRAGMEILWEQLHPSVPVDRYSRYRPEQ
ncbi:MAG TPA: hypothetical protein H9870_11530 [Candidatus Corynebacterium avicola]|uniref:Uncharacterized protein n=1 Tax=Candidatus Corynebacterium avicola TaxID=2838527 RepID=A0A9D1ULL6_9CORY|nr:hypothetical protein [Candidatus Corynebacterium avicola]